MMIDRNEIIADFDDANAQLVNAVEAYKDEDYHIIPFEGSWTAAQVVAHLTLSNSGFAEVLNAEVADTDRPIDELKTQLKAIFLNYGTKMSAPEFILPELKVYDRDAQLAKIVEIKEDFLKVIDHLDLSKTCLSFPLPGLGNLTRYEAIYFVIFHTQRHTYQLNEIDKFLNHA